jgi:hypothetical protein
MTLSREDKIWLAKLAGLVVRAISEVIVGTYKTVDSINRVKDIVRFGATDKSIYERKEEGL